MSGLLSGAVTGEFMIEMAWKSALIAGVALLLLAALRSRAAADRSAVLRVAVAFLLALPFFSLSLPRFDVVAWTPAPIEVPITVTALEEAPAAASRIAETAAPAVEPTIWDDPTILFLLLYLGGVAMTGARLGAGLWTLRRWTRESEAVDCELWADAFERCRRAAGAPESLRLRLTDEVPSPLSWGLVRPVILIDRETMYRIEDADAILAHEIAHVVRRDWAVLMLARVAVGLFWFNPLVRLLERELVQHAEEAADIEAARRVEPARYAQTLVHWAQFASGPLPAHHIAPGARALGRRVRAILDSGRRSTPAGSGRATAAMAACALFALALAVLRPIAAAAEIKPIIAIAPPAPAAPAAAAPAPVPPHAAAVPAAPAAPAVPAAVAALLQSLPGVAESPAVPPAAPVPPLPNRHYGPVGPVGPVGAVGPARPVRSVVHVDEDEIERQVARAFASVDTDRIAREAEAAARHGLAAGAAGMERGAAGMQEGARRMRHEADQLGSHSFRERRIAEAAARGERITHAELIELSRELRDNARNLSSNSRELRLAAAEMRREGRR